MRAVLLIDDNDLFRQSIMHLFKKDTYRFVEASSPSAGIQILDAEPEIRVILLDLSFSDGTSGTEILDHVASRSADYRVIVLTAHEQLLRAEHARHYDIFTYLPKAEHSIEAIRFSVEQAFQDLERAQLGKKLSLLLDIQAKINSGAPLREILDLLCLSVLRLVGGYTCHIRVYDFDLGDYHTVGFDGVDHALRAVFADPRAKGESFSGQVVETGAPAVFLDLHNTPIFRQLFDRASRARTSASMWEYWTRIQSAYIVPIRTGVFGRQVDAVLSVNSETKNYFTAEKQAVVNEFVAQAALAITREWLERKQNAIHYDYGEISRMVSDISNQFRDSDELHGIYDIVTGEIARIVNAEAVTIFLHDPTSDSLVKVAEVMGGKRISDSGETYRSGESLTGAAFAQDCTIHLPLGDPRTLGDPRFGRETFNTFTPSGQLRDYIGVPIRVGGVKRGILRALNKKSKYYDAGRPELLDRGFSDDDRNVLSIAAGHLGVAIRNAELLGERNRQVQQTRALADVARLINSETAISDVLEQTIQGMAKVMEAEVCLLFLKDKDRVVLQQAYGIPVIPGANYTIGEGITGGAVATGKARLITNPAYSDGKYDSEILRLLSAARGAPASIESLMVAPIVAKNVVIGAMKVINKTGANRVYGEADRKLFETFADYVAVAIYNAQIYEHTNVRLAVAERNAALSQLVSAVAHEINNTSGVIPANVAGIREALHPLSHEVAEMLAVIEDVAIQATGFANEIAGFSASRRESRRSFDINDVIADAINELRQHSQSAQLRGALKLSLSSQPLLCEIHRTPFLQIIRNVVLNALQALEGRLDGRVAVSTAEDRHAEDAIVTVEDNGPGIRPEFRARIFEADFTTKPKGNGLGLWLARTQLEQIGGTIDVETGSEGGAKFVLRVPIFRQDDE